MRLTITLLALFELAGCAAYDRHIASRPVALQPGDCMLTRASGQWKRVCVPYSDPVGGLAEAQDEAQGEESIPVVVIDLAPKTGSRNGTGASTGAGNGTGGAKK